MQLQVFDANKDGKLQLSEMAKWVCLFSKMPIEKNKNFFTFPQIASGKGKLSHPSGF